MSKAVYYCFNGSLERTDIFIPQILNGGVMWDLSNGKNSINFTEAWLFLPNSAGVGHAHTLFTL